MDERRLKNIIKDTLNELLAPFKKLIEQEMSNFKTSVQYMSDSFDEQNGTFAKLLVEIKALRQENVDLKQRIKQLETTFDEIEQKEKANNIIIAGIPKQRDSNTNNIVQKIFTMIQVPLPDNEIRTSYRLNKNEDSPILVKFDKQETKKIVLNKIRFIKGTTVSKCKLEGEDKKIYLNEDLTVRKRMLFKKAREIKITKNYKSVYCRNGQIFLKKNDHEPPARITSEDDF
ncbi:uncharacterized protein LOC132698665 [Cylas formicarius]|uniref:uncharacterized protein LOC132698665 n=1 Tax=Cylas formicarius TaxID=197179 RepID=UPI00295863D5|nr:uncharacterized protein LOC132698665 [Cylas formicarius]